MSLALLVPGATGQVGTDLLELVRSSRDTLARGLTRKELDLTDPFGVNDLVGEWARIVRSDSAEHQLVVVNCTAYNAVDAAETDEDGAYAVNAAGPALLATACAKVGAHLIHISTDYVFHGDATSPYDVDDPTGPRSAYGRSKLAGELAVREILPKASHVVRTASVFGAHGHNFVKTMVRLAGERETVSVVDDQRSSPTWSRDLAAGLLELAGSDVPAGMLHATNRGDTTWHGFTQAIFEQIGADPARVLPTTTEALARPASRPAYSVLSPRSWDEAGLTPLPDWRAALGEAFARSGDAFRG